MPAPPVTTAREDIRTRIERELTRHFAERSTAAAAYGQEFTQLWRVAAEHALGGKLVRPLLLVEAVQALQAPPENPDGEPVPNTVIELAAAVELLHYAFLLHDDVIDNDLIRRHGANLLGAVRDAHPASQSVPALHWARTAGILMGDLLLASAHQIFARADLPTATRLRLLDLLDHTVTETVAGEQTDVGLSDGVIAPDLHTILSMTTHKTATYSFELPLRAAAILAGAPETTERALATAGQHLGLAFQLQDDLLSAFGDPREHGKDSFSDLREGKQTVIIAYARMTSSWPRIEPSFGADDLSPAEADHIRSLLTDCGAQRFAQNLVDEQLTAMDELLVGSSHVPAAVQQVLLAHSARLEGRRS
ncbi:MAG: polyprenyl synthetase family protein [Actinomycetota bacterium]